MPYKKQPTATELGTMSVGDLRKFLAQWPDEIPVVIGEDVIVKDDEGQDWVRPAFWQVRYSDGFLGQIMPVLIRGERIE